MKIAVTDTMGSEHKFQRYISWLQNAEPSVETVRLSYTFDNADSIQSCDGLLLTGGQDVDPRLYGGKPDHPKIKDTNRRRDDFEFIALKQALIAEIPVLGICRGLQLANVYFGGTLFADLEEAGFGLHNSNTDGAEFLHEVDVEKNTTAFRCVKNLKGTINSSHHQGADRIGDGLRVSARSVDGVVEALDRVDGNSFFLLVQWHPERMKESQSPFTKGVLEAFLKATQKSTYEINSKKEDH
ncbi:MAG TPA: gamma-glutamyl-gamma-aminobutyrate hydrolase family protein [Bacteroidota bacterium]|nr:gamma-glutamyl-gamma-aminobutyrate hydrolase family protein [Bacteroidota bacterium]